MSGPSSSVRAGLLVVLVAGLFTYALIRLFAVRFATGDVYPQYSSMRSDPDGARLLYDSLARIPGITVARNLTPPEFLDDQHSAIFLLDVDAVQFGAGAEPYLALFEKLAKRGNRVIATLDRGGLTAPRDGSEIDKRWHIRYGVDNSNKDNPRLYFAAAGGWRTLDMYRSQLTAVEREFGSGSVVLFSQSRPFANGTTAAMKRLALVSAAIGPYNRVVFDEQHLGISESGSVVGLARRFRLTGMALGMAICAALFIWKNAAGFPPPSRTPRPEHLLGATSVSGLIALLRRHVPPPGLAAACWREWLAANRREVSPERLRRAEAILQQRAEQPLDALREIQTVLHAKGPL